MNNFCSELEKISSVEAEGEAGVYITAAISLRPTVTSLDLVRVESLQSLDSASLSRLLHKVSSKASWLCTPPWPVSPPATCFPSPWT